MPSITGVILMGAADAVDAALYWQAFLLGEETQWGFEPSYDLPANAGTASFTTPVEPGRYSAREVAVGGAER